MDPFIIKLLEEDEDESMHTEAEVEAFTAALYRDIEGGSTSSQPVNPPDASALSQEKVQTSIQMYSQWKPSSQNENSSNQSHQQSLRSQGQQSSEVEMEHGSSMKIQQDSNGLQERNSSHLRLHRPVRVDGKGHSVESNSGEFSKLSMPMQPHMPGTSHAQVHEPSRMLDPSNKSQFSSSQRFPNQPVSDPEQTGIPANRTKPIPFGSLLPFISSELDKDKVIELYALVRKLKRQEISIDAFVPSMIAILGRETLLLAVAKMQAKSQIPSQQPHLRPPAGTAAQFSDRSFGQLHQNRHKVTTMTQTPASGIPPHTVSHKISDCTTINIQDLSKLQQQHFPLSRSSFPRDSCFTGSNINTPATLANPQPHYPLLRPGQIHRGIGSAHEDGSSQFVDVMQTHKIGRQDSFFEPKRMPGVTTANVSSAIQHTLVPWIIRKEQKIGISPDMGFVKQEPSDSSPQGPTFSGTVLADQGESHMIPASDNLLEQHNFGIAFTSSLKTATIVTSASVSSHTDTDFQVGYQKISASAMNVIGNNSKALYKNPSNCLQKPLHALASSPPLPSKQQKVAGAFADQSIDHLNDVTAVSGVNLSEEEAQLFSALKDDNRVTEAFRKAVHEEEDRPLLQKVPLQKKLAEIMTKSGLKNFSNDVERCLSRCVEKRLRGLISSLIRMSKQRVNSEKSRHNTIVTSDVREQILSINREAREEWEKKQAEAEKLRKQNELDSHVIVDVDKEKDEGRAKSLKMLVNKEEDVQMCTTAANLAARTAVGGDDMLSKWTRMAQARQKHEMGPEIAIRSQAGKDATGVSQHGRSQVPVPSPRTTRSISLKDLIAVLDKESQMAKSTFIYRLYDKIHTDPTAEQVKGKNR